MNILGQGLELWRDVSGCKIRLEALEILDVFTAVILKRH